MPKKKRKVTVGDPVAIYARYSSHNQKDASIEQQVAEARRYAAELGLVVVEVYADHALSGKTDRRPAFQRMLRDAKLGRFRALIAWKSSRLGRNMLQAMQNEQLLADYGITVLYSEEDFDDTAAGRFAARSMMSVNQFYVENMAEDIRRGMADNAQRCLVNGNFPLGYRAAPDHRYEIDRCCHRPGSLSALPVRRAAQRNRGRPQPARRQNRARQRVEQKQLPLHPDKRALYRRLYL